MTLLSVRETELTYRAAVSRTVITLACTLSCLPFVFASDRPVSGQPTGRLVLDVRVFEARMSSPDYRQMDALESIVETDGADVEPRQWLATLSRRVPDAFLGVLGSASLDVSDGSGVFTLSKRRQKWEARFGLRPPAAESGNVELRVNGRWFASGRLDKQIEQTLSVPVGQTLFWSSREMELSTTEYISHFRDFKDVEERGELYEHLKSYSVFLILAVTPRFTPDRVEGETAILTSLPNGAQLPELESPFGVQLRGEIEFGFLVGDNGAPNRAEIVRSSIPEVNPRMLGALRQWRFPSLAGKRARLALTVQTEP